MPRILFDKMFADLLTSREVSQVGIGNSGLTAKKF